jgi:hypothetical protein
MRWGNSAASDIHLSATVFCSECQMMVELGTRDCPHAIELHKEFTALDRIEVKGDEHERTATGSGTEVEG